MSKNSGQKPWAKTVFFAFADYHFLQPVQGYSQTQYVVLVKICLQKGRFSEHLTHLSFVSLCDAKG
jgi:hypothetical protein